MPIRVANTNTKKHTARIVTKAVREAERRDIAEEELEQIKTELVAEAEDAGVPSLTRIHKAQKITIYHARHGKPMDDSTIPGIIDVLGRKQGEQLFPPRITHEINWGEVTTFLEQDFAPDSYEAKAQQLIQAGFSQDASWGMRITDARPRSCIECDAEVDATEPYALCLVHRKWYKIQQMTMWLNGLKDADGEPDEASRVDFLKAFNDRRKTTNRARWLTKLGAAEWDTRATEKRSRRKKNA